MPCAENNRRADEFYSTERQVSFCAELVFFIAYFIFGAEKLLCACNEILGIKSIFFQKTLI